MADRERNDELQKSLAERERSKESKKRKEIQRIDEMIHWDKYERQRRVYGPTLHLSPFGRPPSRSSSTEPSDQHGTLSSGQGTPSPRGRCGPGPHTQQVASWENVDIYRRENEALKQQIEKLEREIERLSKIIKDAGLKH